jgi:uncharacterized repeat protein (TIGR02543 family)
MHTLALGAGPGGTASASPPGGVYPAGSTMTLTATPDPGYVFAGWTVDGVARGWGNPATLPMGGNRVVFATFAAVPPFPDLPADPATANAVRQLAARGIIRGYEDGRFGPADPTLRAQMAALLSRTMGWSPAGVPVPFSDRGPTDDELWAAVGTLAARGVARGYPDGTYDPTGPVLHIQTIAFITRAMVAQGWWTAQGDDPALYPAIPAATGHRGDIATWVYYAGPVPGTAGTGGDWPGWDTPATRASFALALWTALDQQFNVAQLP